MDESKTIMIVDDSAIARMMLRAIIENSFDDINVIEAEDAAQAQKLSATNDIDLITLDMNMPGTDGLTIAPTLKKNCPSAKIALLTANFHDRVKDKAETQGLIFIPKPITEDKVIDFIER